MIRGGKKPKPEPVGIHEADLPRGAKYQDVDFSSQDLQDTTRKVTAETIRKDYAGNSPKASVYQAYIPLEDLPSPKFGKGEEDFDRFDYSRPGDPVPIKVEVAKNGDLKILDGNHRAQVWDEQGQQYAPAWVIDKRSPDIEHISENEKAERAEAAEGHGGDQLNATHAHERLDKRPQGPIRQGVAHCLLEALDPGC